MAPTQLYLATASSLVMAFVFAAVGFGMARRFGMRHAPFAAHAFVIWWYLMAGQGLVVAAMDLSGAASLGNLMWFQTLFGLNLLLASAQLWALGYYLIYLWTGKETASHFGLALFAAVFFAYFSAIFILAQPSGVLVSTWSTGLLFTNDLPNLPLLGVLFFLPFFALLGAYFILTFEVRSETQRLRVLVLGVVAALWNLTQVNKFATEITASNPFIGFLLAANVFWGALLFFTYYPPKFIKNRMNVSSIESQS